MTSNLSRMVHAREPGSPRFTALTGLWTLSLAAGVELLIVTIANAADWPAGAFYTVSALALAVIIALLVPIIEPPRTPQAQAPPPGNLVVTTSPLKVEGKETGGFGKGKFVEVETPWEDAREMLAGTYRCTNCGYELEVSSTTHLPPCPECGTGKYEQLASRRVTRDVTDDG